MRRYEMKNRFLPVSKEDMKERKIEQLDFVYVTGDAYVDHPSFGHAIIGRLLESRGYTVGMIPQPQLFARTAHVLPYLPKANSRARRRQSRCVAAHKWAKERSIDDVEASIST